MTNKIVLKDAYKGSTLYQDKIIPPEETVLRFKERLREVDLDILKSTRRIDNGRLGIPVYFSICGKDARDVIGAEKQMGKGATPDQSEASAVMELAERFSFFSFCKDPGKFLVEEYRNIKDPVLPFEAIALSVHDDSDDLDKAREVFSRLPLKWTWAYNLTREEEMLIPFDWFFAINEFNGPSAGNCVEEALIQGICEVIERHVSSMISQNKLGIPAIRKASISDPVALEMIGKYEKAGVRLFISDFSFNTGIPTVGALAYDPSTFPQRSEIVWTAGTTPNPQKALNRALTEVAQLAGDFNTGSNYVASGLPKFRTIEEADFVLRCDREVGISELPDLSHDNMKVEVENCVSTLSKIGMEVIVVNVTNPILQVPAFYTIIPGAHFRERAAGTSVAMFLAKLMAENGDPEQRIDELQRLDVFMPGKYFVKFFLGSCHLSMNEPAEAWKFFEEALTLNPKEEDRASIYSYMGVCLKDLGQYREAIRVLEKAEGYDDERTDIYNLMGFCYFKLKEHEKAIACFRQVLDLDPSSAIDYANIASNYRDMGKTELAVRHYQLALELDPSIEFARDNLARLQES
ncbi:MAG: YcaO-like family protein [Thermodesulfobacteriota bacterium]|nr:YcaO-like family protein [Thermodesulfobacteriota bacterium]